MADQTGAVDLEGVARRIRHLVKLADNDTEQEEALAEYLADQALDIADALARIPKLDEGMDRLAEVLLPWSLEIGESVFGMAARLLERIPELERERNVARTLHAGYRRDLERLEAAARKVDATLIAGLDSADDDGIWRTDHWVSFMEAATKLRACLAPAPGEEGK